MPVFHVSCPKCGTTCGKTSSTADIVCPYCGYCGSSSQGVAGNYVSADECFECKALNSIAPGSKFDLKCPIHQFEYINGLCRDESDEGHVCELKRGHQRWHRAKLPNGNFASWPGPWVVVSRSPLEDNPECFSTHGDFIHGQDCIPQGETRIWWQAVYSVLNPAVRAYLKAAEARKGDEQLPRSSTAAACIERAMQVADDVVAAAKRRGRL